MTTSLDDRISELEVRYSFLHDANETLNSVIREQQEMIDKLTREVTKLKEQVIGAGSVESAQDKPPHY